jgi:hypothetical protein
MNKINYSPNDVNHAMLTIEFNEFANSTVLP